MRYGLVRYPTGWSIKHTGAWAVKLIREVTAGALNKRGWARVRCGYSTLGYLVPLHHSALCAPCALHRAKNT
jgi:hypothetical protein